MRADRRPRGMRGGEPPRPQAHRVRRYRVPRAFGRSSKYGNRLSSRSPAAGQPGLCAAGHSCAGPLRLASRYCRAYNRYLRERALLEWHPGAGSDVPRVRTLKNIADSLCNFVQWCEQQGTSWQEVTYAGVLRVSEGADQRQVVLPGRKARSVHRQQAGRRGNQLPALGRRARLEGSLRREDVLPDHTDEVRDHANDGPGRPREGERHDQD